MPHYEQASATSNNQGNLYPNPSMEPAGWAPVSSSMNDPYYSTAQGPYGYGGNAPAQQQQQQYNPYLKTQAAAFSDGGAGGGFFMDQATPFDQTAGGSYMSGFSQQLMSDPMMNVMKDYGQQVAKQQTEKISRFISWDRLRYYFAVDNAYVGKKLGLLIFPFAHTDWSVRYSSEREPVPPRVDVNAPDLYIPLMAIVTYVLVAGYLLGTQGRFSPEQLGVTTSNALAWLAVENLLILLTKYIMNISEALNFWHTVAFSSYKFVGMIASLLAYLLLGRTGYYAVLLYCAAAVTFFLLRTVKVFVLDQPSSYSDGSKRKLYLLLFVSLTQPFIMWWLTSAVASYTPPLVLLKGAVSGAQLHPGMAPGSDIRLAPGPGGIM